MNLIIAVNTRRAPFFRDAALQSSFPGFNVHNHLTVPT
jgi:hypothetical protein